MFLEFYQLPEDAFGVTPDPRRLFLGSSHREALASLIYGLKCGRGFLTLVAKPGMGKTSLLFYLLDQMRYSARTALIFQTQCNPKEFLRHLMIDLGIGEVSDDKVTLHYQLNDFLLQQAKSGQQVVVMVDEAQGLSEETLESIRLLSNFERPTGKLMQIILAGQPPLAEMLALPSLVQLRQRVSVMAGLKPFTRAETEGYIRHRLSAAGYQGPELFESKALDLIADVSDGTPRKINALCFNALSIGCALRKQRIDAATIREAAADLDISSLRYQAPGGGQRGSGGFPADSPGWRAGDSGEAVYMETPASGPARARRRGRAGLKGWAIMAATASGCAIVALSLTPGGLAEREFRSLARGMAQAYPAMLQNTGQATVRLAQQVRASRAAYQGSAATATPKPVARKMPIPIPVYGGQPGPIHRQDIAAIDAQPSTREAQNVSQGPTVEGILEQQARVAERARTQKAKVVPFRQPDPSLPGKKLPSGPPIETANSRPYGEGKVVPFPAGRDVNPGAIPPSSSSPGTGDLARTSGAFAGAGQWGDDTARPQTAKQAEPVTQGAHDFSGGESTLGSAAAGGGRGVEAGVQPQGPSVPGPIPSETGGNVQMPRLTQVVRPEYPPIARAAGIAGDVVLEATIGKDGSVQLLRYISGPQILVSAAMNAVEQWHYEPSYLDGQPVAIETLVTVHFSLEGNDQ